MSALSISLKLESSDSAHASALPKAGETFKPLTQRLFREHLNDTSLTLD